MSEQYGYSRRVKIPGKDVRRVIGQHGSTIKAIQDQSGARLAFEGLNSDKYPNGRVLLISAAEEEMVGVAHHMVEELCGRGNVDLIETNSQDDEDSLIDSHQTISSTTITVGNDDRSSVPTIHKEGFLVPVQLVKHVVGQSEENLKSMKISLSLSSIQLGMIYTTAKDEQYQSIELSGEKEKIQGAKKILSLLVNHFLHDFPGEDAQLKRINSVLSVASAIDSKAQQIPKERVKLVKVNSTPSESFECCCKAGLLDHTLQQESDLNLKMQMLKIKVLEEKHKFYTKQVEQKDLENYLGLGFFFGKQFGLVNKFATN